MSDFKADPYQRYVLGKGAPWPEFQEGQLDEDELKRDYAKRRELGWQIVQRAFQPAVVANKGENDPDYIPAWLTWYTSREISSLFEDLYLAIEPTSRGNLTGPVDEKLVQCVMDRFSTLERLKNWEGTRFDMKQIQQLQKQDPAALNKMAKQVTYFSPEYVAHYLKNYARVIKCNKSNSDTEQPTSPQEKVACFHTPFPTNAVSVKAAWMHPELDIDFYDTSQVGVQKSLSTEAWATECLPSDGGDICKVAASDPKLDGKIFSADVPHPDGTDHRFRLVGLHIATKELPEWTWTSVWWSPTKNDDFGEDRPTSLGNYQNITVPELQNYKMCNVMHWEEHDPKLLELFASGELPEGRTLAGSMAAAQLAGYGKEDGKYLTYCSNPFIEKDSGMLDSNCIGCHQTAGPSGILEFTRAQVNKRFPSDYTWSFTSAGTAFSTDDNFQRRFATIYRELAREPHEPCTTASPD